MMMEKVPASGINALLSFTAENVRSYRDEVHLSLVGTRMSEPGVARRVIPAGSSKPIPVLPAAGIFGANASGKTAILEAIDDMREVVENSFRESKPGSPLFRRPFLLDSYSRQRPSRFEVELILGGVRWQYGFEIDDQKVLGEYAYHFPRGRQARVFHREGTEVQFGVLLRSEERELLRLLRGNVLLLSAAGAYAIEGIAELYAWFETALSLASSRNRLGRTNLTASLVESHQTKDRILSLLRYADLGVTNVHRESPPPEILEQLQQIIGAVKQGEEESDSGLHLSLPSIIRLTHSCATGDAKISPDEESLGTIVWLALIGPLLQVLDEGAVMLVDELDSSLHPRLVQRLVRLFQSDRTNPLCAQLIFNSHDTNVLGDGEDRAIGRDQVWFTEKDIEGATSLYPLTDFGPRRDHAIERRYLQGRYGAIPRLNPADMKLAVSSATE